MPRRNVATYVACLLSLTTTGVIAVPAVAAASPASSTKPLHGSISAAAVGALANANPPSGGICDPSWSESWGEWSEWSEYWGEECASIPAQDLAPASPDHLAKAAHIESLSAILENS